MEKTKLFFITAVLTLLLLAGCQGTGSATAGEAAAQSVIKNPPPGAAVDPGSIQVLQNQVFENSTFVVLSYNRIWNDRNERCVAMYETHRNLLTGWAAGSGAGSCTERNNSEETSDPMHLSGGTLFRKDQNKPDISHVLGRTSGPEIVKVRLVWKDGQSQEAQVINNSFFAIRTGKVELKTAEGLNENGTKVYEINR
jgi:hypothetical protein